MLDVGAMATEASIGLLLTSQSLVTLLLRLVFVAAPLAEFVSSYDS
jgi:hypothetical protein